MAKSKILSPAEKKAAVATLKGEIKAAKDNAKQIAGVRKEADKVFATANKAHLAAIKQNDKEAAAAAKTLATLEAKLAEYNPTPVLV